MAPPGDPSRPLPPSLPPSFFLPPSLPSSSLFNDTIKDMTIQLLSHMVLIGDPHTHMQL